jgi:hypothetical protein
LSLSSSLINIESEIRDDCRREPGPSALGRAGEEIKTIGSLLCGLARRVTSDSDVTGVFETGMFDVDADADADAEASVFARWAARKGFESGSGSSSLMKKLSRIRG